ncbi:MAG: acyl-CoA dehydratase activase, partial [Desulfobacterales bacterium]
MAGLIQKQSGKKRAMGLCLGASSVSIVDLIGNLSDDQDGKIESNSKNSHIVKYATYPHEGNPKKTLLSALNDFQLDSLDRIAVTGRHFRKFINLSSIPEPESVEYAYRFVKPSGVSCPAIVSAGGETFMIYILDRFGKISNVVTGNKCASGTGEFFLQQLRRMDVSIEEAARWATAEEPYHVSGRCSVFCKSDCTHATNKGIPRSKVTAGLCKMMADKILSLLKKETKKNVMITGGTARNKMMIEYLGRAISDLIVPKEAPYFEALGAALWALNHETVPFPGVSHLFKKNVNSFDTLPFLGNFEDKVDFKTIEMGEIQFGDVCILGLDVGSTTTKAILLKKTDNSILSSVYLRTNGDPVGASRKCYRSLLNQIKEKIDPSNITIEGLGICGSGRQIAGLHALTDGVINEIIAHSTAAVYFDEKVDTIFEIGGQDAKYTFITNGVPSDYAMNEACSAGTGSFLEESAYETLGLKMEDIAAVALKGKNPPNFNDQCAAFIASDIKNAIHEGGKHEDIVAGLVYSICMNYTNRVKGNRPVGDKVFMQGGVCYNKAVPLAMAALLGKAIVVPPEPGLMGAYGVALEVKKRIETDLLEKKHFDLKKLADREIVYKKPFRCKGGSQRCDRRCEIAVIELDGGKYSFGGACNRYYNLRHHIKYNVEKLDLVRVRQQLVFEKYGAPLSRESTKKTDRRIGINRSFMVNSYFPLYSTFFAELGIQPVIPDLPSQKGVDQREAAFCFPGELSHGFFDSLLNMKDAPEFIFLPHFKAVPVLDESPASQLCPLVQGETFYLRAAFKDKLDELEQKGTKVLTPLLDLTEGLIEAKKPLVETAVQMGLGRKSAEKAFKKALMNQTDCFAEMKALGKAALEALKTDPEKTAIVIFSRPYNGFTKEAHMGIPHKLASRGVLVLPLDFLPIDDQISKRHMYWGMGQLILKVAKFVKNHSQLFGTYITNFSCGPDSFILGYFRDLMGKKPSLTLELDSHTADAGLETRIEAFLDIVSAYRQLSTQHRIIQNKKEFSPARMVFENGAPKVITTAGETLSMTDPRVSLLFPSMGELATESMVAIFRGRGYHAKAHPPADETILKLGRAHTSCKECLPLILTTGTLLNYIQNKKKEKEV